MNRFIRLALALVVVVGLATGIAAYATAGSPPNHANRLELRFTDQVVVLANHNADYGVLQIILTGNGTLDGFGAVTVVSGVTADSSTAPCGVGSSSNASTRRITTAEGTLILNSSSITCATPEGRVSTGTFQVDGSSSTGVFAGATGSGSATTLNGPHLNTLSGKLNLANDG
jgi:hypothetical protein